MTKRLHTLERALGQVFGVRKRAERAPADPHYAEFRAECKRLGITYKLARDGYLELSNGRMFPHHGDWQETLERLKRPESDPE